MTFRDPKIFIIEVFFKNPFKHKSLMGEYILDVTIGGAYFSTTKDIECAASFSLDQASIICSNFNKLSPEHFVIKLKPQLSVPIEYGKDNYTLPSHLNDFNSDSVPFGDENVSRQAKNSTTSKRFSGAKYTFNKKP
jgi:hypothetical protein